MAFFVGFGLGVSVGVAVGVSTDPNSTGYGFQVGRGVVTGYAPAVAVACLSPGSSGYLPVFSNAENTTTKATTNTEDMYKFLFVFMVSPLYHGPPYYMGCLFFVA